MAGAGTYVWDPDGGAQLVHTGSHGCLWIPMAVLVRTRDPNGGAQLVRTGSHGHLWVLTAVQLGTYGQPRVSVDPDGGAGTYTGS
jgi:hypothetical protein